MAEKATFAAGLKKTHMSTFFKRPKTWVVIALLAVTAVTLSAWVVRHSQQKRCVDIPNSVYYWKTRFYPLDSNEKAFLTGNNIQIGRASCRERVYDSV